VSTATETQVHRHRLARTEPVTTQRNWSRIGRWAGFGTLLVFAILWLLPLLWAIDTALKPEAETTKVPVTWWTSNPSLSSFRQVLDAGDIIQWYINSFITSTMVTVLTVLTASMAAYAFSQLRFPYRTPLFLLLMAGLLVPPQLLVVPLFSQLQTWHMINTYWGVALPQVALPIALFVLKQFFDGIPKELEEAARVDGAGRWYLYWRIWMPLARPAVAAVSIFSFVWSWNNFLWPLVVITSTKMFTIPLGLGSVSSDYGVHYAEIMASAVLGGLPLLIVFLFFQRQIVNGVAGTEIKG
jgi:multiple sugar transport system permease protein